MSENARAMINQCVAFILFLRVHRVMTTIRLATIETTTERYAKRVDLAYLFICPFDIGGYPLTTYQPKWQTAQWDSCIPVGECRRIFQPRHHCLLLQHRRLSCCCSRWQQAGQSSQINSPYSSSCWNEQWYGSYVQIQLKIWLIGFHFYKYKCSLSTHVLFFSKLPCLRPYKRTTQPFAPAAMAHINNTKKYFLRPFSMVPLAVESTQLTLCHSLIWQINPWVLVDSKSHQPLLNVNSFIFKCWFVAKDPRWKWRIVGKCIVVHVVICH